MRPTEDVDPLDQYEAIARALAAPAERATEDVNWLRSCWRHLKVSRVTTS